MGELNARIAADRKASIEAAANRPNGYAGLIQNNEAPLMDLMSQMQMYQQGKGARNEMQQKPQSSNPYQQMQDSRYAQMLGQPAVSMPTQQAQPTQIGSNDNGMSGQQQQNQNPYQQAQPLQQRQQGLIGNRGGK